MSDPRARAERRLSVAQETIVQLEEMAQVLQRDNTALRREVEALKVARDAALKVAAGPLGSLRQSLKP
jgi:cytidylate kinase